MDIGTKSQLVELFTFLVPGILVVFCLQLVRTGPKLEYRYLLLHYVVAAVLYQIFVAPFFEIDSGIELPAWVHRVFYYMVVPVLLGLIGARLWQADWPSTVLHKITRIKVNPAIDSAWDYTFSKTMGTGRYAIVNLVEQDKPIFGFIGPSSYIGTGEKSDLLIENLYEVDDEGQWTLVTPARSLYLTGRCIESIELIWSEDERSTEEEPSASSETGSEQV